MPSNDDRNLLRTVLPTAAVGAIATVISAVFAGGQGAIGGVLGAVVVIAFFGSGLYALAQIGRRWPEVFLGAAMLVYTTQILVLLLLLKLFRDATFMDGRAFGLTALVCVLVWLGAQARAQLKSKTLYVEPASDEAPVAPGRRP
ncbi:MULTISPECIES: hypothetical protein [unclassified Streptomyces]|uniref:hypothetical protein n=1 Tax=unclassified Streptomyces TaxID=2593676 RepID=UPI00344B8BD4